LLTYRFILPMLHHRIADWLETHWLVPAYSGWLMIGLAAFFFGAATNTMAGWLYVISGVMLALLAIAAVLPERSLRKLQVHRAPIQPISVGDAIAVELVIENLANQPTTLLQVEDRLPSVLSQPVSQAVELIPANGTYHWSYRQIAKQRGVYRWQTVALRTGTPLGLFWCRRYRMAKATAIVYPTVLPLTRCPLIDAIGQDSNHWLQSEYRSAIATEGLTRTLRPYRWGDSTRLIHWRTSARYGELRIRELETYTGGQELIVCLDSAFAWQSDLFEQAVIAAASLYFYALHHDLRVSLWTAATGLVRGDRAVLETLAATQAHEAAQAENLPNTSLLWLTQNGNSLNMLPNGSRWLLWTSPQGQETATSTSSKFPGLLIHPDDFLQSQLQASPKF
jgi:uncharacterized protein (DUF58 family)